MLTIRREQLLAMLTNESCLTMAIRRLVQGEHAAIVEGLPEDIIHEMIGNGLRAARHLGLSRSADLAGFVLIMFEVGPEFYRHPRVRAVLENPDISAERKLDEMFAQTDERVWEEIVSVLHRQTWFPELRNQEL